MNTPETISSRTIRFIPIACALFGILTSLGALVGWYFDLTWMKSFGIGRVAMNPLTAISFMLIGVSLICVNINKRSFSLVLASAVIGFVTLKFIGFFGHNIPIDQILFYDVLSDNKMAPNTAFGFLTLALSILLFHIDIKHRLAVSNYLAFATLLISIFSLLGYVYNLKIFYGVADYIPMALNTALVFFLLSIGTLLSHPEQGPLAILVRRDAGGKMLRRLLPAIFLIPPTLSGLNRFAENSGWYNDEFGISLLIVISICILASLTYFCAVSLSRSDQTLRTINLNLEQKVHDRVSELQETEKQIQHLQKMDAIGRLAGGVAHDFNNILGAIQMYCDIIEDMETAPGTKERIEQIRKASTRGAALTKQLLLFSRQQVYQHADLQLNDSVSGILKMLHRLIPENIQIMTTLAPDLPLIRSDATQIEQAIMNLVINARDAMPSGGKLTIDTHSTFLDEEFTSTHLTIPPGEYVVLTISDNGHGMDEKTKSQIFDPFFTTKPIGQGTGLGLSTTYGIIKTSKASIWVYSEPDRGTVFKIYFPAIRESKVAELQQCEKASISKGHETILIVEDEETLRELFSISLTKQGYRVYLASSGKVALELIRETELKVDLLLTDVIMPDIGGVEVAKQALKLLPQLKVLFMSGYADEITKESSEDFPHINFIQKPFSGQQLAKKIREIFSSPQ
jgi:signal transduction histidine kinase